MVPVYVKSLLPSFCRTYQSTMITSVKKSSLNLIKKMVYYLNSDLLQEMCVENTAIVGKYLKTGKKLSKYFCLKNIIVIQNISFFSSQRSCRALRMLIPVCVWESKGL